MPGNDACKCSFHLVAKEDGDESGTICDSSLSALKRPIVRDLRLISFLFAFALMLSPLCLAQVSTAPGR